MTLPRFAFILCILGALVAVGGRVYHVVAHPEWTEPQALKALWYVWLTAVALIGIGAGIISHQGARP